MAWILIADLPLISYQDEDVAQAELAELMSEISSLGKFFLLEIIDGNTIATGRPGVLSELKQDSKLPTWLPDGAYTQSFFRRLNLIEVPSR